MSSEWTCVIVDDEEPARRQMRALLRAHPVVVLGEASDVPGAVEACRRHRPSILFLDIQLRGRLGLDVLPLIELRPWVVLVSGHDRYGVQAYDLGVHDYLLKPVSPSRLGVAMARVKVPQEAAPSDDAVFLVAEGRRQVVVPWREITHVEGEENDTKVHLVGRGTILVRRTMAEWEQRLPRERFMRAHRSLLIRIDLVTGISAETRDDHEVTLAGGVALRVGRMCGARIRRAMEGLKAEAGGPYGR
jgi:two-component system LytT family response regulator